MHACDNNVLYMGLYTHKHTLYSGSTSTSGNTIRFFSPHTGRSCDTGYPLTYCFSWMCLTELTANVGKGYNNIILTTIEGATGDCYYVYLLVELEPCGEVLAVHVLETKEPHFT